MADSTPSSEGLAPTPRSRSGKELRLELKRTRGQISCAECRRYVSNKSHKRFSGTTEKIKHLRMLSQKLKCDKNVRSKHSGLLTAEYLLLLDSLLLMFA